jgi:hypothetical protein
MVPVYDPQEPRVPEVWLADIRAGLEIGGVKRHEIRIHLQVGFEVIVTVRGEPKYKRPIPDTQPAVFKWASQ